MSIAEANLDLPSNFTGVVKVFPLPNLVLFPGVIQPLHIFEPRYRQLMEDSLNSDQLVAVAKLKPGWDETDSDKPAIHRTVCIGKIVTHAELPDGRFNLLLLGAKRANIIREIPGDLPYRLADVKLVEGKPSVSKYEGPIREQTLRLFNELVQSSMELDRESIGHLLEGELPFGLLLDLLTFSCGASLKDQQAVLETTDILDRSNKVIQMLQNLLAATRTNKSLRFPPRFSYN